MTPQPIDLARRALYLARWASRPTFVGRASRLLMNRIGHELQQRGLSPAQVVALVVEAKRAAPDA
jgi:hypothetical protein